MKHLKTTQELNETTDTSDDKKTDQFGLVNIRIDGVGYIKRRVLEDIRKILSKYQGERHLFVDDKEVNPYR
jgi:hypothetical protein